MQNAGPFASHPKLTYQCPLTRQPLTVESANNLPDSLRDLTNNKATDFLMTLDQAAAYPIIEGLPVLTAESAIGINLPKSTVCHARQTDIADETKIYDQIASQNIDHLDQTIVTLFGTRLTDSVKQRKSLGNFPSPLNLWVDSMGAADAQWESYQHLARLTDTVFLQLGGSGSHAIKALLAGAAIAGLVSPSIGEIRLGQAMATEMGVDDRFFGIVGIGENIPLSASTVDRIYGGGCLHHTEISLSLPELSRITSPGGRLSFVDPRTNPIYAFWSRISGQSRFCGAEEETHDHPIDEQELRLLANKCFGHHIIYASGGPLRYALILIKRSTGLSPQVETAAKLFRYERTLLNTVGLRNLFGEMATLLTV